MTNMCLERYTDPPPSSSPSSFLSNRKTPARATEIERAQPREIPYSVMMARLADEVFLKMLRFLLDLSELCRVTLLCRRFWQQLRDPNTWVDTDVDFRDIIRFPSSDNQLMRAMRAIRVGHISTDQVTGATVAAPEAAFQTHWQLLRSGPWSYSTTAVPGRFAFEVQWTGTLQHVAVMLVNTTGRERGRMENVIQYLNRARQVAPMMMADGPWPRALRCRLWTFAVNFLTAPRVELLWRSYTGFEHVESDEWDASMHGRSLSEGDGTKRIRVEIVLATSGLEVYFADRFVFPVNRAVFGHAMNNSVPMHDTQWKAAIHASSPTTNNLRIQALPTHIPRIRCALSPLSRVRDAHLMLCNHCGRMLCRRHAELGLLSSANDPCRICRGQCPVTWHPSCDGFMHINTDLTFIRAVTGTAG